MTCSDWYDITRGQLTDMGHTDESWGHFVQGFESHADGEVTRLTLNLENQPQTQIQQCLGQFGTTNHGREGEKYFP